MKRQSKCDVRCVCHDCSALQKEERKPDGSDKVGKPVSYLKQVKQARGRQLITAVLPKVWNSQSITHRNRDCNDVLQPGKVRRC